LDNGDDLHFDEEKGIVNLDTGEVVLDIKLIYPGNYGIIEDIDEEEKDHKGSVGDSEDDDFEEEEDEEDDK
jgi:hypothetical protein